jgi:DNA adenine methylase
VTGPVPLVKPCFNYFGGKGRLAPMIAGLLPEHRTYVEPFADSLAAFLAKRASPTEVLNDADEHVVHFFRVLRERPDELIRACELTPYARAEYNAAIDYDGPSVDPVERARRRWVRTNMSIGKHPGSGGSGFAAAPNTSSWDHPHKQMAHVARMRAVVERLRPATIECRPALEVLAKYATRPDVVVYADPPYLGSTRQLDRRGPRDYQADMQTEADHRELADALRSTPATVLLSGYGSPLYAELYSGWERLEVTVDGPSSNGHGRAMAKAIEVIWSNRPMSGQLRLDMAGLIEAAGR